MGEPEEEQPVKKPRIEEKLAPLGVTGRVCFRRCLAEMTFLDILTVGADDELLLVETRLPDNVPYQSNPRTARLGDAVRVVGEDSDISFPSPKIHKKRMLNASTFHIVEPFSQLVDKGLATWSKPLIQNVRPTAILQCTGTVSERVAAYFDGVISSNYNKGRHVFVYDSDEKPNQRWREFYAICVTGDFARVPLYLHGVVTRVFLITERRPYSTVEEVVSVMRNYRRDPSNEQLRKEVAVDDSRLKRVMGYPRVIEKKLAAALTDDEGASDPSLVPTMPGAVDTPLIAFDQVCYSDGFYWVGLSRPRFLPPEIKEHVPSGAYWKLWEIQNRYLKRLGAVDRYMNRALAFDIGASPGGWSFCCVRNFATSRVMAVDPATQMDALLKDHLIVPDSLESYVTSAKPAVTPTALADREIVHLKVKGQQFVSSALERGLRPAIYVCDMNVELGDTTALAKRLHDADAFDKPALVVLTFKNTYRGKVRFAEKKEEALKGLDWLQNREEMHLFANTDLETTIVGEVL
ncbi:hypothetical protein DIPPA_21615 [Diplonema papillatum]|nr:hypothetical protein DIPPA_21615 [Diplonema papillatum]